jgi:hypothetical protein
MSRDLSRRDLGLGLVCFATSIPYGVIAWNLSPEIRMTIGIYVAVLAAYLG